MRLLSLVSVAAWRLAVQHVDVLLAVAFVSLVYQSGMGIPPWAVVHGVTRLLKEQAIAWDERRRRRQEQELEWQITIWLGMTDQPTVRTEGNESRDAT